MHTRTHARWLIQHEGKGVSVAAIRHNRLEKGWSIEWVEPIGYPYLLLHPVGGEGYVQRDVPGDKDAYMEALFLLGE